jgi:hypothetical protein
MALTPIRSSLDARHDNAPGPEGHAAPVSEARLVFDLRRRRFALPLLAASGVMDPGPVERVPGSPPGVLGLGQWRGRIVTVLDLARLTGDEAGCGGPRWVRLAPPLEHLVLQIAASVEIAEAGHASDRPLLDAAVLVENVEAAIARGFGRG